MVSGYKVLGSDQRTSRFAVLQHGSLLLQSSRWAPQLPGVLELTSRSIAPAELANCFAEALAQTLSIRWSEDEISHEETRRADEIGVHKFASDRWLLRR